MVSKSKNEAISAIQFIILVKMLLDSFATVVNSTHVSQSSGLGRLWPGVAKTAVLLLSTVLAKAYSGFCNIAPAHLRLTSASTKVLGLGGVFGLKVMLPRSPRATIGRRSSMLDTGLNFAIVLLMTYVAQCKLLDKTSKQPHLTALALQVYQDDAKFGCRPGAE